MSITTKRGDSGTTDLLFGGKASKTAPQVESLGEVDELNAVLGLARVAMDGEAADAIDQIQKWLVTLMGEETKTDFRKALKIVMDQKFHGWIGVEYEGKTLSEVDGIKATKALLEKVRAEMA
ncbi:ATP:cob(I)alamin adenosyltransferase [Akkermansiaceae bacterium]|nr:ATP:cob(I)alamin adenosyltransferase [Akkermansiaceae bacterium]